MQKLRKSKQGFTIIEVLIVLAIAGLILLIVFLAVPALQRNSRNNGRRNDISRIASVVNDYVANNNGQLPNGVAFAALLQTNVGNTAQYDVTCVGPGATCDAEPAETGGQGVMGSTANRPHFRLVTSAACAGGGTTSAASDRQGVLQYQLETSNPTGHTNACLDI